MEQEHGRVLGEAIGGGALPKLEDLSIAQNKSLGDNGVVPIMAGLEGGGCRHLKDLCVYNEYGSIFKLQMNVTIRPQNHLLPSSNLLG